MKRNKLIITIGICGVLAFSGCTKAPVVEVEDPAIEDPAIEAPENDIQAEREGVNALKSIVGDGVEKIETVFPDENQSYIIYDGIDESMRENYKESLLEVGYRDWMVMESEDEGLVYETALTEDTQVTLIYSMDPEVKTVQVYMIENIDELIETEPEPEEDVYETEPVEEIEETK